MTEVRAELPEAQNVEYQDLQWRFNGAWMPDRDAAVIGPENYADLQNLRYNDGGLEGVNGYTKINTTQLAWDEGAGSENAEIKNGFQLKSNYTKGTYTMVHGVNPDNDQGRIYVNETAIPSQGDFAATDVWEDSGGTERAYFEDASVALQGRFSNAPGGAMSYSNSEESIVWNGEEMRCGAVFVVDDSSGTNPRDYTIRTNNTLQSDPATDFFTFAENAGATDNLWVFSTRPLWGIKVYIKAANVQAGAITGYYWSGSAWVDASVTDNTASGGATLAQTGTITWEYQGTSVEQPKHYQELYMYAYRFKIVANTDADIYHITCNAPMQKTMDLWDGVYRQPIQCQFYDDSESATEDYTLHVNESSDINTPIGLELDGMTASDALYIQFEDQMVGIKFTMLSGLVNKAAETIDVEYWDGSTWGAVTDQADGTTNTGGTKSFNQTGTITWTPESDEQPQLAYGTYGYMYKFTVAAVTLTGTHGDATEEVYADLVTGVPAQKVLPAWKFPVQYKNRLMLCNYSAAKEGNRMDYCVSHAVDAWNGLDSSDNGLYSLYFGGDEPINAAAQLYNRFGSNIFATLVVLKDHETYLLVGDTPDDFRIYPVSFNVGCPAPLTLATAETGLDQGGNSQELQRNIAIWLSHAGPVMFDGAMLMPIEGVSNYFDPNDSDYINTAAYAEARGWYDSVYKEYNLLIPTGGSASANTWLVYDLKRKRWYKKDTGSATLPLSGFNVTDTTGGKYVYAGLSNGYVMRLENGTNWDGVGIAQKVKTGDFWPSNNIWDETLIRNVKIIARRIQESHNLYINYFGNTAQTSGVGVTFVDSDDNGCYFTDSVAAQADTAWAGVPSSTLDLSVASGLNRLTFQNKTLNRTGWAHAFEWEVTTDDTTKGFQPVAWGIRYYVIRKQDTES
jgi:hypothetical protein